MKEDDILGLLCAGALILIALVVIAVFILNLKSFTYRKKKEGSNTCLTVTAKRNLSRVIVQARFGNEEIKFERKRVRKGQSIDFVYPASNKPARLIIEPDAGSTHTIEV